MGWTQRLGGSRQGGGGEERPRPVEAGPSLRARWPCDVTAVSRVPRGRWAPGGQERGRPSFPGLAWDRTAPSLRQDHRRGAVPAVANPISPADPEPPSPGQSGDPGTAGQGEPALSSGRKNTAQPGTHWVPAQTLRGPGFAAGPTWVSQEAWWPTPPRTDSAVGALGWGLWGR